MYSKWPLINTGSFRGKIHPSSTGYAHRFFSALPAFECVKWVFPDVLVLVHVNVNVNVNVPGQPVASRDQDITHSTLTLVILSAIYVMWG